MVGDVYVCMCAQQGSEYSSGTRTPVCLLPRCSVTSKHSFRACTRPRKSVRFNLQVGAISHTKTDDNYEIRRRTHHKQDLP